MCMFVYVRVYVSHMRRVNVATTLLGIVCEGFTRMN